MKRKFYDYGGLDFGGGSTPKPYFAKYLPVEGEIKEGDLMFMIGSPTLLKAGGDNFSAPAYTKVKLFLCSRDVKMGDKVKIEDGSFNDYQIDREEQIFNGHLFYKVIGEISREATWVKEGNEFDESEVRKEIELEIYWAKAGEQYQSFIQHISVTENYELITSEKEGYYQTLISETIQIKGPCGHFH